MNSDSWTLERRYSGFDADRSWRQRAACIGADPEIFYPQRGEQAEAALDLCGTQPQALDGGVDHHRSPPLDSSDSCNSAHPVEIIPPWGVPWDNMGGDVRGSLGGGSGIADLSAFRLACEVAVMRLHEILDQAELIERARDLDEAKGYLEGAELDVEDAQEHVDNAEDFLKRSIARVDRLQERIKKLTAP